tara:strand:+ start:1603 stop:3093 length:1491 start_codon:yes stop_codon:yes gene_type:complete
MSAAGLAVGSEIAGATTTARKDNAAIDVGLMRLCGRDLAVPAANIREVVPLPKTLHPDFSAHGECAGAIVIRGRMIPVLDIAARLGFPARDGQSGVVVILRDDDALIGLIMDMVSGLARIPSSRIQPLRMAGPTSDPVIESSFPHRELLVGLINPKAVFAIPGLPHAVEVSRDTGQQGDRDLRSVVLVSAADTNLAIDATIVVATLPGVQLRPSVAPASDWKGVVSYLGVEVPVIDDLALFDLTGTAAQGPVGAIVILKLDEKRMVGLKIDRVRSILPIDANSVQPLSGALGDRLTLFAGAVRDREGLQSLLFDSDALRSDERLRMLGALCRKVQTEDKSASVLAKTDQASGAQQPYVIFRMGERRYAASLASVKQIIPLPEQRGGARPQGSALQGVATYNGAPLPLLGRLPDDMRSTGERPMVLIVEKAGSFSGLVVDKLENIVRASPRRRPGPTARGDFIQARMGTDTKAVPVCNLLEEADRLAVEGTSWRALA